MPCLGLDVPPPIGAVGFAAVPLPHGMDVFPGVPERLLVERRFFLRHMPTEIHDPLARRAAGYVHAVHPRLENVRIRPPVRVRRQAEPRAGQIARNVEGATLGVAP